MAPAVSPRSVAIFSDITSPTYSASPIAVPHALYGHYLKNPTRQRCNKLLFTDEESKAWRGDVQGHAACSGGALFELRSDLRVTSSLHHTALRHLEEFLSGQEDFSSPFNSKML